MSFIHLHNHTEYSLLDGAMKIERLIERAVKFRMPAVAITDHGNLFGVIEFYKNAHKRGIKPIIGIETYIAPDSRFDRKKDIKVPESSFHLTLLCENETGYKNLIKLASFAYLEGFYYKPRIDKDLLVKYHQGLIGLSGCFKGEISYRLAIGDTEGAMEALQQYQDILGKNNFYIELMRLGLKYEQELNNKLIELSHKFDAPLVATNDCHYLGADDYKPHDILLCIGTKKTLQDRERLKFETQKAYFRSPEEMVELFTDLPEAITNTKLIAERCNLMIDTSGKNVKLPIFPRPDGFETDFEYLRYLALEGIHHRYKRPTPGIEERLNRELGTIKKVGLSGYFLIVREIINFAREQGIPVGPGRGSAVGSLVLYSLGITDVDPIRFNLIFERFLNPERISLPDIDADFGDTRRDEVIDFIKKRYGEENVTQVITFGTMQARAVVRDVGRVMGISYNEVDRIAKLIPFHKTIDETLRDVKEFKNLIESNNKYKELIEIAKKLEGLARHPATHAAGVVITPTQLIEYVPLFKSPDRGEISTQYAKNSLEDIGILKMDILGLRTLTVIDETLKQTGMRLENIPYDDAMTYNLLKKGETTGVFQLESQGMQEILRNFQPECFEDLIAVIALYRPGPMANLNLQKMIENKKNPSKIKYLHPLLEPVLKETYGMILYQEQVIQIASRIAGFSFAEGDILRRAMGKKIPELMNETREKFIAGAVKNRISNGLAEKIFNKVAPFAGYGFNKSHAAAYAVVAYQTAYLKCHKPLEFFTSLLNSEIDNTKRLSILIREIGRSKIEVLLPDINKSNYEFKIDGSNISYGLGALKNLGKPIVDMIVKERSRGEFKSFYDFLRRLKNLSKKSLEILVKAGAFSTFEPNANKLLNHIKKEEFYEGNQQSLFGAPEISQEKGPQSLERYDKPLFEKESFGFYFSKHPLERFQEEYNVLGITPITKLNTIKDGENIAIGGIIAQKRLKKDKNNRNYAIISLEDFDGSIDIFVFSELFERNFNLLKPDIPLIIKGKISGGREDRRTIRAQEIIPFKLARNYYERVLINLNSDKIPEDDLKKLHNIINNNQGSCEIWFKINGKDDIHNIRSRTMKIKPDPELFREIKKIIGDSNLKIYGKI